MREKILSVLEQNARIDFNELAILIGEDAVAVEKEIKKMEEEKVICGYHTLINWDSTNDEKVIALIEVKVTPQRGRGFDKIAEAIYNYDEVGTVYLMSGGFDFTVIIEGKTMKEVAQFVSDKLAPMDAIQSTATHFVLKKYKENGTKIGHIKTDERMKVTF